MNHGEIRYGNSYNPYPYGNPSNNVSTASVSSLASTSSKILSIFKSKDKPPPVPEKDYPYASGRSALPSSSSLSLSMTLSDAGTTTSSHSGTTNGEGKRSGSIFKLGRKSKKNKGKESQPMSIIGNPQNVKHEMHVDDGLNGFPPEWRASLLQLGYTPEEIEEMIQKKRQKPSLNSLTQSSTGSMGPNHAAKPSTSSSAYRYPSPPPQFGLQSQSRHQPHPSTSTQHSISAYHTLKLQTDLAPIEGNLRLYSSNSNSPAGFTSSVRSIPNRSDSPSGSISSNKQSHAGSDHRASPVPSIHRDRDTAPTSNLSRESQITVSPRIIEAISIGTPPKPTPPKPAPPKPTKPSRVPPPILFSDTSKANTYKPPKAIAVQDEDSDDEPNLSAKGSNPQVEEKPHPHDEPSTGPLKTQTVAINTTSTNSSLPVSSKPNTPNPSPLQPADSNTSVVMSGESTPTPDIKATPISLTPSGIPRISLSLGNADVGTRNSVDWSESLFSALPSATAFDGFRSSITPKSSSSGSVSSKRLSRIMSTPVDGEQSSSSPLPSSNTATTTVGPSPDSTHPRAVTPLASAGRSPLPSGPLPVLSGPSSGPPQLDLASNISPFGTPFSSSLSPQSVSRVSPQSHSSVSPNSSGLTDTSSSKSSPSMLRVQHLEDLLPRISLGPVISSGDLFPFSEPAPVAQAANKSPTSNYRDSMDSFTSYDDSSHENDRSVRESVSSYGGIEEEYIEPVVVVKATAVKLARVPSVSFQRRVDMMSASRSATTPDTQKAQAASQVVMLQSRGVAPAGPSSAPPFTPLGVSGVESMPSSAPASRTMHTYRENDYEDLDDSDESDEDEEDDEDEDDPDSRYTIRVDNVKADQLMAAIMQSKGEIDISDVNKLTNATAGDSRYARDTVQGKPSITAISPPNENSDSYANSRPISTTSVTTIKPDNDSDEEPLPSSVDAKEQLAPGTSSNGEDAAHVDEEDEDSSALDEWLEANEVDEQETESDDDYLSGNKGDGSEYDDADRPLSTPESSSLPKTYQADPLSPIPPASARSLSPGVSPSRPGDKANVVYSPGILSAGSNSTDTEQSYDADTSERGTPTPNTASTNATNGAIDALLSLNSPGITSSGQESVSSASPQWSPIPGLSLKQRRQSQIFIGNHTQYNTAHGTGPVGRAGIGKRASVRSSMIYAPLTQLALEHSLKSPPTTASTDSERNVSPITQYPVEKSNLLSKRSPSKYPDLLKPLILYINDGDPRKTFTNLEQIAEGESGDIFAASMSKSALPSIQPTVDSEEESVPHIVAIKCVRVEEINGPKIASLKKEAVIFSTIGTHQSILVYSGMWIADVLGAPTPGQPDPLQELWIQMDLMERSLADLVALADEGLKLQERHVSRFTLDVVLGLTFLEERFVAHRDLRSDNLLISITDGHVKIADFTQAVQLKAGDTIVEDPAGIIYWQAPEMRRGPYDALKVDVWSLGATVWELIEGETPFESDPDGPSDRLPELTDVQGVSQGLLNFLARCELPASRRTPARELLEMPFILARCTREEVLQLLSKARTLEQAMISET